MTNLLHLAFGRGWQKNHPDPESSQNQPPNLRLHVLDELEVVHQRRSMCCCPAVVEALLLPARSDPTSTGVALLLLLMDLEEEVVVEATGSEQAVTLELR